MDPAVFYTVLDFSSYRGRGFPQIEPSETVVEVCDTENGVKISFNGSSLTIDPQQTVELCSLLLAKTAAQHADLDSIVELLDGYGITPDQAGLLRQRLEDMAEELEKLAPHPDA